MTSRLRYVHTQILDSHMLYLTAVHRPAPISTNELGYLANWSSVVVFPRTDVDAWILFGGYVLVGRYG